MASTCAGSSASKTSSLGYAHSYSPLAPARRGSTTGITTSSQRGGSRNTNTNKNRRTMNSKSRNNNNNRSRQPSRRQLSSDDDGRERMRQAKDVEARMLLVLEGMKSRVKNEGGATESSFPTILLPSVRECNAALATLGDAGELLRALRLFGKMRKAAALSLTLRGRSNDDSAVTTTCNPTSASADVMTMPPAPTLVTYSTLMSRAIYLGKAPVALRLWKLMKSQAEFFRNIENSRSTSQQPVAVAAPNPIVPDVKAANILMNSYAKLGDYESALDLMNQMTSEEGGDDVPPIPPNLVTWNTLVDACHRAGDLSAALDVYDAMTSANVRPDARTYTSLISTVARRSSLRGGAKDPSPAFTLFEEMRDEYGVQPNGMTYCALIDVCGRCQRSDLALKGLRMMLRQKEEEGRMVHKGMRGNDRKPPSALYNEVGAWTAAIDACGRAGRIDTALKLFSTMRDKFGVMPNTVTCGCITDILLRAGRTTEALDILRFMKEAGIEPSEVMYTSLMTSAGRMARKERRNLRRHQGSGFGGMTDEDLDEAEATEVYTELMSSLLEISPSSARTQQRKLHKSSKRQGQSDSNAVLLRVFLVFQEMLACGVKPDLACYNSLLRACSRSGDIARMTDVMKRIASDGLDPNEVSWRQLIKGAARAERSDLAEQYWNEALSYVGGDDSYVAWTPNSLAFEGLIDAYMREAAQAPTHSKRLELYAKVVSAYEDVLFSEADRSMSEIDVFELHENPRVMLAVLRAAVSLELARPEDDSYADGIQFRSSGPKKLASNISTLESLQQKLSSHACDAKTMKALNLAKVWAYQDK